MIRSFRDRRTADFAAGKRVKAFQSFDRQAQKRLRILADAERIEDLAALRSNRFEALGGDRAGQFSIRINIQWRICFSFLDGDAFDVEITDYH
jgi:toxin HigB-1